MNQNEDKQTRLLLEDLIERAVRKDSIPQGMSFTQFIDWVRSLYPELYLNTRDQKEI